MVLRQTILKVNDRLSLHSFTSQKLHYIILSVKEKGDFLTFGLSIILERNLKDFFSFIQTNLMNSLNEMLTLENACHSQGTEVTGGNLF